MNGATILPVGSAAVPSNAGDTSLRPSSWVRCRGLQGFTSRKFSASRSATHASWRCQPVNPAKLIPGSLFSLRGQPLGGPRSFSLSQPWAGSPKLYTRPCSSGGQDLRKGALKEWVDEGFEVVCVE